MPWVLWVLVALLACKSDYCYLISFFLAIIKGDHLPSLIASVPRSSDGMGLRLMIPFLRFSPLSAARGSRPLAFLFFSTCI